MSGLTEEQRRRIEENKQKALAKRAAKQNTGFSPVKQGNGNFTAPGATINTSSAPAGRFEENKRKALAKRAAKQNAGFSPGKQVSGGAVNFSAPGAALNRVSAPVGPYSQPQTGSFSSNNNNQGYNTRPPAPTFPSGTQPSTVGTQPRPTGQAFTAGNQSHAHVNQVRAQSQPLSGGTLNSQVRAPSFAPRPSASAPRPSTSPQVHAINRQSGSQVNPAQTNSFYGSTPTSSSNYRQATPGKPTYSASSSAGQNRFNQNKNFQQKPGQSFQQRPGSNNNRSVSPTKAVAQIFNDASKASAKTKGTCVLVQRSRFEVQVGFHSKLIELFKSMPTRLYNSDNRRWSFHLKEYQALMMKVGDLREEVFLEGLPRSVLQVL